MATTYLTRTPSSATNRKTFTFSFWYKVINPQIATQQILSTGNDGSNMFSIRHTTSGLRFTNYNSSAGGGVDFDIRANRQFRDTSGWYHIVCAVDTTQATASDRVKVYTNGEQETSFSTETYPSQNLDTYINNNIEHIIGRRNSDSDQYFEGILSHFHLIDGTAYDASAFGEFDANGVWKIKTSPSVTYGTNGFFILKDGNSVTDQSGNSNNFTVAGGTLTNTEDNPSNVFATLNPLVYSNLTYGNGNTIITNNSGSHNTSVSTIGVNSGKWYCEAKFVAGSQTKSMVGITEYDRTFFNNITGSTSNSYSFYMDNGNKYNNGVGTSYSTAPANGDIIMVAFDADNGTLWFGKNGTWLNNATQSEIENGTTTNSAFSGIDTSIYLGFGASAEDCSTYMNFGNGYFGTTAVASAGTNASGIGIFEYDVPTGYTALSTKGLNL